MSSIQKIESSGRWRARFRARDKTVTVKHFKKKVDAQAWIDDLTAKDQNGNFAHPRAGKTTFHEWALEWSESRVWTETTKASFGPVLRRIEGVLPKGVTLDAITPIMLDTAQKKLVKRELSMATVTLSMKYLVAIVRAAKRNKKIMDDPTEGRKPLQRKTDEKVGPNDVPTSSEVLALLAGAPTDFRAAIALGASGMRVGEVLGLTADRVHDVGGVLHVTIDRQLQRIGNENKFVPPKRGKVRTIIVPNQFAFVIRGRVRDVGDDALLFTGPRTLDGLRRDQMYDQCWRPALRAIGLDDHRYRWHSLRHWCASSMLEAGEPITAVAEHLGDSLEVVQRVYAHWLRGSKSVAANALDQVLADAAQTPAETASLG